MQSLSRDPLLAPCFVPCALCGVQVDAWRAPAVRFSAHQQLFFCSRAHAEQLRAPFENKASTSERPLLTAYAVELKSAPPSSAPNKSTAPAESSPLEPALPAAPEPRLLLERPLPALPPRPASSGAPPTKTLQLLHFVPALVAACSGGVQIVQGRPVTPLLLLLVLLLGSTWVQLSLAESLEQKLERKRQEWRESLDVTARRVHNEQILFTDASELRAGEEILVGPGEIVPAEGTLVEGEAQILPWPTAGAPVSVEKGSSLLAGARVLHGSLRMVCTVTGEDRSLHPLLRRDQLRTDRALPLSRLNELLCLVGAPLFGLAAASFALWQEAPLAQALTLAAALAGACSGPLLRVLPSLLATQKLLPLTQQGISFPSAEVLERAGKTNLVVFNDRGTVRSGAPEVTEITSLHPDITSEQILERAAGALSAKAHPIAQAILRAAQAQNLPGDATRNHQATEEGDVICTSSQGATLVVGKRELLLRERISIARAEDKLRELESQGQNALLVAEDQRLLGLIALLDGLKPGARAMVQLLSEAGLEPVLLSSDAPQTVETVAHALGIEHFRAPVPANERAREIQHLASTGASVAVVGRLPADEAALLAAPVPLILGSPSLPLRSRSVSLALEHPLHAASALVAAQQILRATERALLIAWLPTLLTCIAVSTLLLAPFWAPLSGAVSLTLAWFAVFSRFAEKHNS